MTVVSDATAVYEPFAGARYQQAQDDALHYLRTYYGAEATASQTLVEYAQVQGPGLAAGQIVLRNGLNRSYGAGAGTDVQFVTATPAGSASSLLIDADAGDGVLVTDQLFQSGTLVADGGSPALVEYHELGAIADGNGYYGFEGVGRVQQLFLRANPATPGTPVLPWAIEFDQPINVVDLQV